MYSEIVDGKVLDYRFKKLESNGYRHYAFYIGDIYIGQLFGDEKKRNWSCVSCNPNPLFPISGFRTRLDACEILLKEWRLTR